MNASPECLYRSPVPAARASAAPAFGMRHHRGVKSNKIPGARSWRGSPFREAGGKGAGWASPGPPVLCGGVLVTTPLGIAARACGAKPPRRPRFADDILHALALATSFARPSAFPRSGVCRHTARHPRRPRPVAVSRPAAWGARVAGIRVVLGCCVAANHHGPPRRPSITTRKSLRRHLRRLAPTPIV